MSAPKTALSAAADDRKTRLAKLRSLKRKQPEDDAEVAAPEPEVDLGARSLSPPEAEVARLYLTGRNYDPETRNAKLGFDDAPTLGPDKQTLEEQAAELEAEAKRRAVEDEANDKGIDLFKLQPKKPNWDLKRELNKKLEVLNVRTDNAIAKLVRERLEAKKAAAVQNGETPAAVEGADGGLLEGAALEMGIRMREQEEKEEERREREDDDLA